MSIPPLSDYRSSSEVMQVVGGAPPDHTHHTFGVPTIRSDLPAPHIRRVGDGKVCVLSVVVASTIVPMAAQLSTFLGNAICS